jgi:hypothetical protein
MRIRHRPVKPTIEPTIVRAPKIRGYFKAANAVFSDERLSWEARGLMGYLLSKPDDWQVRLHDLLRRGPAGQHKIRRMQRELEAYGYLRSRRFRRDDGTFSWTFTIYEDPGLAPLSD